MTVVETPKHPTAWRVTTIIGLVIVAIGLGMLGYVGWQYYGTNIISKHKQAGLSQGLNSQWNKNGTKGSATDDKVKNGDAIGLLRIPRFGKDYEVPIVKGVDPDDLASGVGWFPKTARPGQIGNFAIAGHRVTHGEPFHDFPDLRKGDKVIVETRTNIYTYVLRDNGTDRTVDFTQTWILDPVPGHSQETATKPILTMMTCSELFHTDNRYVVFGDLKSSVHK